MLKTTHKFLKHIVTILSHCVQSFHIVYDLDELIKFSHFLLTLLKHKEVKRGDA